MLILLFDRHRVLRNLAQEEPAKGEVHMKVIVIGGNGPTGPHMVEGLHRLGYEVTIYHQGTDEVELPTSVKHIHGNHFNSG